jgi:hypothetical protein
MLRQSWEVIAMTLCGVVSFACTVVWAYHWGGELVPKVGLVVFGLLIASELLSLFVRVFSLQVVVACLMAVLLSSFAGLALSDSHHQRTYLVGLGVFLAVGLAVIWFMPLSPASPTSSSETGPSSSEQTETITNAG